MNTVSLCCVLDPRPPRLLDSYLCFFALDCDCTWGSSIPTQLCAFKPLASAVGTFRGTALRFLIWFLSTTVLAVGTCYRAPEGSLSLLLPMCVQAPHQQLSGVSVHELAVPGGPVLVCLETVREATLPPLVPVSSGGAMAPHTVQVVADPLHRLNVEIKATLYENTVLLLSLHVPVFVVGVIHMHTSGLRGTCLVDFLLLLPQP